MKGIFNKPMIELDSFINVEEFNNLTEEIITGLSRSSTVAGSWGPGVFEKREEDLYNLEGGSYYNRGGLPKHKDYDSIMAATNGMTLNQKRLYLKLKYNLYNAGYSVYIRNIRTNDYKLLDKELHTDWDENKKYFPNLINWIYKLPFSEIGRVLFFVNEHYCVVTEHSDLHHANGTRDYIADKPHQHEFIWIRPKQNSKPFYVLDEATNTKHYIRGQSSWFNSFDIHGADAFPSMTWSLRIDGKFTNEFRNLLS